LHALAAVSILQDHFGQTDHFFDAHMQALFELPTHFAVCSFHDSVESYTHGLSSLGKSDGDHPKISTQTYVDQSNAILEWLFLQLISAIPNET